ncbi:QRFP-like peptide receptor [Ptychodera flava]|uniref:QRFP-like peptide receptor n=1 Tax=Ptychodera flava TaxID=63121 RepID=UPI00396A7302
MDYGSIDYDRILERSGELGTINITLIEKLLAELNFSSLQEFVDYFDINVPSIVHEMSLSSKVTLGFFYSLVFVLAVAGNILVIMAVVSNKTMQTVTNVFIVSLAISNFMIAIFCIPFTFIEATTAEWVLGSLMCKILPYMTTVPVTSNILTLTCIAVNRYYAVCFPLQNKVKMTKCRAVFIAVIIWLVAMAAMSPQLFVLQTNIIRDVIWDKEYVICMEVWPRKEQKKIFTFFIVGSFYLLQIGIMTGLYARIGHRLWAKNAVGPSQIHPEYLAASLKRKRRATLMLILVVVLFAVCWAPFQVVSVIREFPPLPDNETNRLMLAVVQLIAFCDTCINPFIYAFLNENFRKRFISSLRCKRRKRKRVVLQAQKQLYHTKNIYIAESII